MSKLVRTAVFVALLAWALVSLYVIVWVRERYRRGGPIPVSQAGTLLHPMRERLQPVRRTLERFGLEPGATVLELGPGPGYFSIEAARLVGESGRLLCLDLQPGMLARLQPRLEEHGVDNAYPVAADATRLPLGEGSCDAAFLVAVLGEVPDRVAALRELRRVLKPGGALAFCETLTDPDYVLQRELRDLCLATGFEEVETRNGLLGYTARFRATA